MQTSQLPVMDVLVCESTYDIDIDSLQYLCGEGDSQRIPFRKI